MRMLKEKGGDGGPGARYKEIPCLGGQLQKARRRI